MARRWDVMIKNLNHLLEGLSVDKRGKEMESDEGFRTWAEQIVKVRRSEGRVYLIGNGASASMASHFCADMSKNGHLNTQVFTDSALMSAVANDMGFEWVFADPLRRRGKKGDMLIAMSCSGLSPNIIKAVDVANRLEIYTVTMSASDEENPLRTIGRLNFFVPARSYGDAESCYAIIMQHLLNQVSIDESKTVEIKYDKLFGDMGRPKPKSPNDSDSALFLP